MLFKNRVNYCIDVQNIFLKNNYSYEFSYPKSREYHRSLDFHSHNDVLIGRPSNLNI